MIQRFLSLVSVLATLSISSLSAQPRFSRDQLNADLDTLTVRLERIHPDLYAEFPQAEYAARLKSIRAGLPDSLTRFAFYGRIAPLVAALGDGHTGLNFPEEELAGLEILPYGLQIDDADGILRLREDLSPAFGRIPEGAEIISINGRSGAEIAENMISYSSGESRGFRIRNMNLDKRLGYMYLTDSSKTFDIRYSKEGETGQVRINALPYTQVKQNFTERYPDLPASDFAGPQQNLTLLEEENTAVLEFQNFVSDDRMSEWKAFLDSVFTLLQQKQIGHLVIDLRRNGGGYSGAGDELFHYFAAVPFTQFGSGNVKLSPEFLASTPEYPYPENVGKLHVFDNSAYLTEPREYPNKFTGKVYLLTSPFTFSSAASFTQTFSHLRMGTVIGEETGGYISAFGDLMFSQLPESGLHFYCSHKTFVLYGGTIDMRHGVRPEIPVPADSAMEKALEVIRSSR